MSKACKQKPIAERAITPRLLTFCLEFARSGKAEEAARIAGYSGSYARHCASRMLQDPRVQKELARLRAAVSYETELQLIDVVREVGMIAFADLRDFCEWDGQRVTLKNSASLDLVRGRAIVEVKQTVHGVSIKLADKSKAHEQLLRYLGAFDPKRPGGNDDPDKAVEPVRVDVVDASTPRADP